jgi:anti-sigma factor RsiW
MSCPPFDLRDYFLKELPESGRQQVEHHLKGCQACREELDRLRVTEAALLALRDEEIPQRIAFVSDKIFEPSPLRRGWQAFWTSGARLGFVSAAMLSVAILFSALTRPVAVPASGGAAPGILAAGFQHDIARRVDETVRKAAAEIEERQTRKTAEAVAAIEKRNELDRKALMVALDERDASLEYLRKRLNRYVVASNDYGPPRGDDGALR